MMRYYLRLRPATVGTFPKPQGNEVLNVHNYDKRTFVKEVGLRVWGYVEYALPVSDVLLDDFDMVAEKLTEYEGKKVWIQDEFSFDNISVGDYVDQDVVDDLMDLLPPACMSANCSQIGEPYSHRQDPDTGAWKATYATFKKVHGHFPQGVWMYCGYCFRGENVERGSDPVYV